MQASRVISLRTADGTDHPVTETRHPTRSYGVQFHTVFTTATADLARKVKHASTIRLFIILPEHLSYTDWRRLNQEAIGRELDLDNSSISRALAELLSLGVIERKGRGPVTEWRLSSDYGWRGTVDQFHEHRRGKAPKRPTGPMSIDAEGRTGKQITSEENKEKRQRPLRLLQSIPPVNPPPAA